MVACDGSHAQSSKLGEVVDGLPSTRAVEILIVGVHSEPSVTIWSPIIGLDEVRRWGAMRGFSHFDVHLCAQFPVYLLHSSLSFRKRIRGM